MSTHFEILLYEVSEDLGAKEWQAMIFLCGKEITVSEKEKICNARDLFTCMRKKNLISESDLFYLMELLFSIQRIDTLNKLYKKMNFSYEEIKKHSDALATQSKISAYRLLLYKISENIADPEGLKFCIHNKTAKIGEAATVLEVLVEMEKTGIISQDNLENLKAFLKTMKRIDLLQDIENFERQIQGHQMNNIQNGVENISFQERKLEISKESKGPTEMCQPLKHSETYEMKKNPHGWCVIVNNYDFSEARSHNTMFENRKGTDLDTDKIKTIFESRNYIFQEHKNMTSKKMLETMELYANKNHDDKDSFVCFILSHGKLGCVYGTDGVPVPIKQLTSYFNGQHCKSLVGKPKVFFIQACQGDKAQQYVTYETDSHENTDDAKPGCLPVYADFLTAFATVEDFASLRAPKAGSIYIQTLCKLLNDPAFYGTELCNILTDVNKKISEENFDLRNESVKQMPSFKSELRKRLILPAPTSSACNTAV